MYPSLQVLHILFHLVSPYWYHHMHSFAYLPHKGKQNHLLFGFPKDRVWATQSSSFPAPRTMGSSNLDILIQLTYQITTLTTRNSDYYLTLTALLAIPSPPKLYSHLICDITYKTVFILAKWWNKKKPLTSSQLQSSGYYHLISINDMSFIFQTVLCRRILIYVIRHWFYSECQKLSWQTISYYI